MSSGAAEFITFKFRLENGQLVYRNAPPLLSSRSVTWKMISGILGTDLSLDYRQWIKARSLKDLDWQEGAGCDRTEGQSEWKCLHTC